MGKKNQVPNYKLIHGALITDVQIAYENYKNLKKAQIDNTFIDRDGRLCVYKGITQNDVDLAEIRFTEASRRLRDFEREHRDKLQYAGDHKT